MAHVKTVGYISHPNCYLFVYMYLTLYRSLKIANILLRPLHDSQCLKRGWWLWALPWTVHHHCKNTVASVKRSPFGSIDKLYRTLLTINGITYVHQILSPTLTLMYVVSYGWAQPVLHAVRVMGVFQDGSVWIKLNSKITNPYFLTTSCNKEVSDSADSWFVVKTV